jgi:hypothetical protein
VSGNASRGNGRFHSQRIIKGGAVPVMGADSSPAFLQLCNYSQLDLASLRVLREIVDDAIEQLAKLLSQIVIQSKVIGKVV